MGNAMKKDQLVQETVQLDVRDALSAVLQRAQEVPERNDVICSVSSEDWKNMDESQDNVLVYDPD